MTKYIDDGQGCVEGVPDDYEPECLNCGGIYCVDYINVGSDRGRLWCCRCGYWADRRKPNV